MRFLQPLFAQVSMMKEWSDIFAGDDKFWTFTDRDKALRSIRRLNKNVPVYIGVLSSASTSKIG